MGDLLNAVKNRLRLKTADHEPLAAKPPLSDEKKGFLKRFGASEGIALAYGFVENYGQTSHGPNPLPYSNVFPSSLWDKFVTGPLGSKLSPQTSFLASYPYWLTMIFFMPVIPFIAKAIQAFKRGEPVKPHLKDAAAASITAGTVEDAAYWLSNPAFKGDFPYTGMIPKSDWVAHAIPVAGQYLGATIPGLNLPVFYAIGVGTAAAYLYHRLHRHQSSASHGPRQTAEKNPPPVPPILVPTESAAISLPQTSPPRAQPAILPAHPAAVQDLHVQAASTNLNPPNLR